MKLITLLLAEILRQLRYISRSINEGNGYTYSSDVDTSWIDDMVREHKTWKD
jgi:hypothetical protein